MGAHITSRWKTVLTLGLLAPALAAVVTPLALRAEPQAPAVAAVTFTKDIAPILQRSCENCHRSEGVAPMSLQSYEDVRPWARAIKQRTGLGPKAGVMPPWYVEKNIGIQKFKNDPSLSAEEIAMIARWADSGAPRGNPSDMPPARVWNDNSKWSIGTPDLVIKTTDILVKGTAPDWWGEIPRVPTGLTEDRYVAALEIKEVNDAGSGSTGRETVGGRFVFHHMIWSTRVIGDDSAPADPLAAGDDSTSWPVHEVGREADFFDAEIGALAEGRIEHRVRLGAPPLERPRHHGSSRDCFKFMPKGYKPEYRRATYALGNGVDIDIRAMEPGQQLHAYALLKENTKILSFEPHLHAPGARMCLEAIWGYNIQTINCVGYDHNWVRGYDYDDDSAPLLPKDTILHIVGYMDNSPSNKNVPDPRNWQGSGNRSVANMFIDLGNRVFLTDEAVSSRDGRAPREVEAHPEQHGDWLSALQHSTTGRDHGAATAVMTGTWDLGLGAWRWLVSRSLGEGWGLGAWGARLAAWATTAAAILLLSVALAGQSLSYSSGQNVSPAYEGWEQSADGTKYFVFGYMNRNWQEEIDVPVGADNGFNIGDADQGQPTRFLPRRNRFVFRVPVPKGFSDKDELIWTLTTQGKTEKAYASLRLDYQIDDVVRASETGALGAGSSSPEIRANKPPTVEVQGRKALDAKVGEAVTLIVEVGDDGVPKRRGSGLAGAAVANTGSRRDTGTDTPAESQAPVRVNRAWMPPARVTVGKNVGLHVSWFVYRGKGSVTFTPEQVMSWEDTRAGANSPWAPIWVPPPMPPNGQVSVQATFWEPGVYVLRARADDGALTADGHVTVTVKP